MAMCKESVNNKRINKDKIWVFYFEIFRELAFVTFLKR